MTVARRSLIAGGTAGVRPVLFAMVLGAGTALSQTLPQVTISATRTEAAPFDVPAASRAPSYRCRGR